MSTIVKSEYIDQHSLVTTQILSTADVLKPATVDQYGLVPPRTRTVGFNCEFCEQRFHLKDHLIKHISKSHQLPIKHVETEDKSYIRKSVSTENQSLAAYHQSQSETKHYDNNYSHSSARPFKCSLCENAFKSNRDLKSHQRIHTNERQFQCNVCEKSFKSRGEVNKHQRCHSDERPFQCFWCEKAFKTKTSMKRHQRTHSDERPFHCNQCEKSFKYRDSLKQHQRIHSAQRSFQCDMCEKLFISKSKVKRHQQTHQQ
eukprot:881035_1